MIHGYLIMTVIVALPLFGNSIYLYHTEDSSSVEFFDCIYYQDLAYCRRPIAPVSLQRDKMIEKCYHNGTLHTFIELLSNNINVSTVLHQWRSSIETAEQYARYIEQQIKTIEDDKKHICQCIHPQAFGKFCEYLLPINSSRFEATVEWEFEMKFLNKENVEKFGDILCYRTLVCDFGLLCLDWRDICDGIQQCMHGYDEENCDLLEFNECEDDEYRCMNGMCIPDEFFVDGDYDCMDFTDEINKFNDVNCTFEHVHFECDDRMCLPNQWSCGDGQCIKHRFIFQALYFHDHECSSRRDQYYMCETSVINKQWTLPNGRCDRTKEYEQSKPSDLSRHEMCLYVFKCHLSDGAEKNCLCRYEGSCLDYVEYWCPHTVYYPWGRLIAPYAISIYSNVYYSDFRIPVAIQVNGIIKCRGFRINKFLNIIYWYPIDLRAVEMNLCTDLEEGYYTILNGGYDRYCYNGSMTMNKQIYRFIDICEHSKECISVYRIKDGIKNCYDEMDEKVNESIVEKACSHIKRHRFRCSIDEPRCFFVHVLGDKNVDCENKNDELWMHTDIALSEMICNRQIKKDCQLIRQYIEASWYTHTNMIPPEKSNLTKIPFRKFCDTFFDLGSKKDEMANICQRWWKCFDEQWQCHTGQCIDIQWVLDGEWDCSDASDEESIFTYDHALLSRNLKLINQSVLIKKFKTLYSKLSFYDICNLSIEYPCFRVDVSNLSVNITQNRPCIRMEQIGDGHIDCIGGQDERNVIEHCISPTTLGNDFMCLTSGEVCINTMLAMDGYKCPNSFDNLYWHEMRDNSSVCQEGSDAFCLNGTCIRNGKCDRTYDCLYGEDEYMCQYETTLVKDNIDLFYREKKRRQMKVFQHNFQLPRLPSNINDTLQKTDLPFLSEQQAKTIVRPIIPLILPISYVCNRGVGVLNSRGLMVCFCPPQYYGLTCEFHNDRLTVILHLNFLQSNYVDSNNLRLVLKLLVVFLFENQTLDTHEFHVRPALENMHYRKLIHPFLYSRSNSSLNNKRMRYFNRSNIITEHPYTIRIECYEMNMNQKAHFIAIWQYPIYFDYLPSFRLSKILRLTKLDNMNNPCLSNPCSPFQECHQLQNQKSTYICLCPTNFTGPNCSILDPMCANGFCSSHSLCKSTYRSLLDGYDKPYCICSLNTFGRRCDLIYDICIPNPCQNNGTCLTTDKPNGFLCICNNEYYGTSCELRKQGVWLYFNGSTVTHIGVVLQYLKLDFIMLDLVLINQRIFTSLPDVLFTFYDNQTFPEVILIKFYSNEQIQIYLISLQFNVTTINATINLTDKSQCKSVMPEKEMSPIQYHSLCINHSDLICFYDKDYLCICSEENVRAECFGYDHYSERCSRCLADGQCLQENHLRIHDFICLCPRCHRGSLCQFNTEIQSFSLDSLVAEIRFESALLYLILTILIFVIGTVTNYASFVTFKRPRVRQYGVGKYLLFNSLLSQCSLVALLGKTVQNLFRFMLNHISCKIVSYILAVSTRCSFWLISWVTLERLFIVIFPYNNCLKKSYFSFTVIIITCLIVLSMHVHDLIFYIAVEDINGQMICVADFKPNLSIYNRINLLLHYLLPFSIQIVSITLLIIFTARSHSHRTTTRKDTLVVAIKNEFIGQKELYITPLIMILSSSSQVILSFIFACTELSVWQRHLLLTAYFLSYTPQLFGFLFFVLSSTTYLNEFRNTQLARRYLFKWILLKK